MRPTFLSRNVEVVDARIVGDDHLKLTLKQDKCSLRFDAIAFGQADKLDDVKNLPFHIVFNIEENTWNKRTTLQFNIKDIKFGQLAL